MLNSLNERIGHSAGSKPLCKLGGVSGGLIILTSSKQQNLTRVRIGSLRRFGLLLALDKVEPGLQGGLRIAAQNLPREVEDAGGKAHRAASRTELLSRSSAEHVVLVRQVEAGARVTGIQEHGESGAACDAAHNLVQLVVHDGAGNLVVNGQERLVVAITLVAAGVNDLRAVARKREPERVARPRAFDQPSERAENGTPVRSARPDVPYLGVDVGQDDKVLVLKAELGLEQVVHKGDIPDAAPQLILGADVVDADQDGALAAGRAEGADGGRVRVGVVPRRVRPGLRRARRRRAERAHAAVRRARGRRRLIRLVRVRLRLRLRLRGGGAGCAGRGPMCGYWKWWGGGGEAAYGCGCGAAGCGG
ncbi:hypothetical protein FGB62_61g179 [Gracilaria domingensis]|nr:hypothetical protein FGB62_61g179 [Gracilaria domingensis]